MEILQSNQMNFFYNIANIDKLSLFEDYFRRLRNCEHYELIKSSSDLFYKHTSHKYPVVQRIIAYKP